jgi:hypothetical protein
MKKLTIFIIIILSIGGVFLLQKPRLDQLKDQTNLSPEKLQADEKNEKLNLQVIKEIPSFGFNNIIANWTFLQFLQYFGDDEIRRVTGYRLSPEYFEIIIKHDPFFLDMYNYISSSVSLYAGMPEESVALMDKGLESMTPKIPLRSYYVWRNKAIDELLFLGESENAQKSFETAAQWAQTYADQESQAVAQISLQTASFLATKPDSRVAQINAWSMVAVRSVDQTTRDFAISRIEALGGIINYSSQGVMSVTLPKED